MPAETNISIAGDLSKPATVLIERIAEAIGGMAKPWQTKRLAIAEAQAQIIHAQGRVLASDIERRGIARFVREEGIKQNNIEEVTAGSIPLLNENARPESMDKDWIFDFIDKCKLISNTDIQNIWSCILAGEANSPGTFSKRTIFVLSSMDHKDAALFQKLGVFCWHFFEPETAHLILYNWNDSAVGETKIEYDDLLHLSDIGLVHLAESNGYGYRPVNEAFSFEDIELRYFNNKVKINFTAPVRTFHTGLARLTPTSLQLLRLIKANEDRKYFDHIIRYWETLPNRTVQISLSKQHEPD